MTYLAFEGYLLVVQLLYVAPVVHLNLDGFRQSFPEVHFHTDPCTGLHVVLGLTSVDVLPYRVPDCFDRFISPAMQRQMRKTNPYWYCVGDVQFWIKVRSTLVKVKPSGVHEVGTISEYEILVCFGFEVESVVAFATETD